jgi:hypothetical protein
MEQLMNSIYNKRTEIHYNSWYIRTADNQQVKIELQGKIKCPLLNANVSSLVCSKLMDKADWPRGVDPDACKKCDCFINLSIRKFQDQKPRRE